MNANIKGYTNANMKEYMNANMKEYMYVNMKEYMNANMHEASQKICKQQTMKTNLQNHNQTFGIVYLQFFSTCNLVALFAFNFKSNRNRENINICV